MQSREDFYMIKQMRQQGAYIVDIATQVSCSERTVRRYLKYPEPPARKTRHKMVKLKPFMDYIDMRLAENVWNSEVILAEIKAMGYTGERSMLRYYIQPKRKMRPSKRTVRFETQPGYQLQHDWGEVEAEVAGLWLAARERKESIALLPVIRSHWKTCLYLVVVMACFNFFSHGTQELYPTFLKIQHGFNPHTVSIIAIFYNIAAMLGGIFFGAVSESICRKKRLLSPHFWLCRFCRYGLFPAGLSVST